VAGGRAPLAKHICGNCLGTCLCGQEKPSQFAAIAQRVTDAVLERFLGSKALAESSESIRCPICELQQQHLAKLQTQNESNPRFITRGDSGMRSRRKKPPAAPNAVFFIRREESDILKVLQPISHSSRIAERICPACVGGGTDIVDQCLNQVAAFANRGMVFALNEKLLGVGQVLENDSFVLQPTLPD
jgi:hypothetical protein